MQSTLTLLIHIRALCVALLALQPSFVFNGQAGEMPRLVRAAAPKPTAPIESSFSDANWTSMGGVPGANGEVLAAIMDDSGNLYIGGEFTVVDQINANHIAKWDGSRWTALGSGVDRPVRALAISGSDLYAGGFFTTAG